MVDIRIALRVTSYRGIGPDALLPAHSVQPAAVPGELFVSIATAGSLGAIRKYATPTGMRAMRHLALSVENRGGTQVKAGAGGIDDKIGIGASGREKSYPGRGGE